MIKSKRLHLPLGFRVRPRALIYFLAISAAVGGFVVCIPLYFYWQDLKDPTPVVPIKALASEQVEEEAAHADEVVGDIGQDNELESVALTLDLILEKHRSAIGLEGAQSILLSGKYVEDGREFEMKLAAKMPTQIRKTLRDPKVEIACIFDGENARVEVTRDEERVTQVLDDVLYQNAMILEGAMMSLGMHLEDTNAQYHRGKDQTYEGRNCWTIVSLIPGTPVMSHLIDPETGLESARYLNLVVDEKPHQVSLHFSDYRAVDSFHFPHVYILKIDGKTRGSATIESVKYNPGLMPWMF